MTFSLGPQAFQCHAATIRATSGHSSSDRIVKANGELTSEQCHVALHAGRAGVGSAAPEVSRTFLST